MRIFATGSEGLIDDDRPQLYISGGQGNIDGQSEVFLQFEANDDTAFLGWFLKSELLAAIDAASRHS